MTVHIQVSGKVQGVYFRASTLKYAQSQSLVGYVQNEIDGSVSIIAQGDQQKIKHLQEWCYQGVTHARVDSVLMKLIDPISLDSFTIRK